MTKRAFRGNEIAVAPSYPTLEAFDASRGRRAFLRRLVGLLLGGAALAAGAGVAEGGQRRPEKKPSGKKRKKPRPGKKPQPGKKRKKGQRKKPRKPHFIPIDPGYPPSRRARLDELEEPGE